MSDERQPVEQVLAGQTLHPLEPGWTALASFHLIKCLDDEGDVTWAFRTSEKMNLEELLGALVVQTETLRRRLVRQWEDDE